MNNISNIQNAIQSYAEAYKNLEILQHSENIPIPAGDQKTGCIGEFYAYTYLQNKNPKATLKYGTHSEKGWDIQIKKPTIIDKPTLYVQVKTVSEYSKTRVISAIHHGWDWLFLLYLNKDLKPEGFWIIKNTDFLKGKEKATGKRCPDPNKNKPGSTSMIFGDNLVQDLRNSIDQFYAHQP